ncbi:hypothetical protein SADUNF_Sadunf03G0010200 [Salix dunnii]|uniref:ACT domain-containing protein ACR n=1 Tax=Salix dunnii TaxID=1413687 RepID=A0A835K954_9ROSI|nr:hypothetical protein SADUNF_Sadunf03G0010200 [Salix dunnii]
MHEDVVGRSQAEKPGESTVFTVNCPDKTGLGCDLCRVVLLFGLSICREDAQTDRKRCYLVFWAVGKPENQQPKPPDVFLLKFWCSYDREGLLHGNLEFHSGEIVPPFKSVLPTLGYYFKKCMPDEIV